MATVNVLHAVTRDDENLKTSIVPEEPGIEFLDGEPENRAMTAETLLKTLPTDVTLIVQNKSYTLRVLESYKQIVSEAMRNILKDEGHRSYNFRRYGHVIRNITTAIKLKTELIRDLFQKLKKESPESIARTSYSTVVHYQTSLLDYQQILINKQKSLRKELKTLQNILTKIDSTFILLQKRAEEISELLSSVSVGEITSYPPEELEKFHITLESALDRSTNEPEEVQQIRRQALIKVLEGIGIQTLSVKENRKYRDILNEIETHLGPEKSKFVTDVLARFSSMSPREIARTYETTIIKHNLFLLSHLTLLLENQENLSLIEQYNEISQRISAALNIKLNPYKEQLSLRICDELTGINPHEIAAYQTLERIQEYRKALETSLSTFEEDDQNTAEALLKRKALIKVIEAEGIQMLMWEDSEKHKKYQELLGQLEHHLFSFKDEFLQERLARFADLTPEDIAQKHRVNTIKHNVLLLARLSLLLNIQDNPEMMTTYYTVSKNIFEALNLKLEEANTHQEETNIFREEAKLALLESDLFRSLSNSAIERIVDRFKSVKFSKGEVIIDKGQKGDSFFVIKSGKIQVGVSGKNNKVIQLAVLKNSDCFGEMSLLTGNPASASITALENVNVLCLSEEHFNDILLEYPVLNRYFHRILSERLRDTSARAQTGQLDKGLAGKFSTISLEDLIQTLYTANKSGILTIEYQEDKGKVFIKHGLVIHAITKNLKGEHAFFRIMTWYDASFRFVPGEVNEKRTVTMNVHGLLLEAMKRIDDMRQIKQL